MKLFQITATKNLQGQTLGQTRIGIELKKLPFSEF